MKIGTDKILKRWGILTLLALVTLYCLGPFIWQFLTSLKAGVDLTRLPPLLPPAPTSENYVAVFKEHPFLRIIMNSLVVATSSTVLSLFVGSLAAFISTVSPLYLIIRTLGLRDTVWALIMTYTTFTLPLTIWVLTNFFRQIPHEIYTNFFRQIPHEIYLAARVDGCTRFQIFYKIFIPLAAPGIFATAILVFIFSWNEFLFALTFTSTVNSRTIPVGIALFPGIHEVPWGEIAAASVVVTVPIIALVFVFQKRIVEGLTMGALKG
jgi:multiple sugar transport system permease protein